MIEKKNVSLYEQAFREVLAETGMADVDPRHAEAWARLEWGTLDRMSRADMRRFVEQLRVILTNPAHRDGCELLARSYGL